MNRRLLIALRWAAGLLGLVVIGLLAQRLHALHYVAAGAQAARQAGPLGALAVFGALIGGLLLLLPMVPLVMAAGWIYGMAGAALSLPAATVAAVIAFAIGRGLGHTGMQRALTVRPRLRALAELAETGGLVTVALLRVSPILPFTPSNAVLGMTKMPLRDLALGTLVGILPGGLLYTSAGALLPDAEALARGEAPHAPFWAMLALGVVSMAIIGVAAGRKLRALGQGKPPVVGA